MLKVKLVESKTLPVPQELIDNITDIYRAAYIKLVVDFIQQELNKDPQSNLSVRYQQLFKELKKKYSKEFSNIGVVGFTGDLTVSDVTEEGQLVESMPVERFITDLLAWPGLETYLRGRIKPKTFKTHLKRYFKNKKIDDIQFNIEFGTRGTTSKKDYAGLYVSKDDAINIVFNSSFFIPVATGQKDRRGNEITVPAGLNVGARKVDSIIENIETELEDTRISVRHELQHLFQNTMSNVLGAGDWNVGLPPSNVLNRTSSAERETPHHMQPIEMQTDIQDEVDKFLSYVDRFRKKNPHKSALFPQAAKIMLKLFADSKLTNEENKFSNDNDLKIYITPSELLRIIKSGKGGKELYNYAIKVLYTSISNQLQESIIMDKIKVVLKESQILTEELTKEEIRKIIRDELEKLLKNKEIKKDFAKITKDFVKKFYRELSMNSTYVVDRIDV